VIDLATDDRRRDLRDSLDELDKYFEELERDIQEAVRKGISETRGSFGPFMAGFSFKLGPEGKPSIQFFGDSPTHAGGYRSPLTEQIMDEKSGTLRLLLDMPGVEKSDIEVSVAEDSVVVKTDRGDRKYRAEMGLRARVNPDNGKAEYRNGVLEISLPLRDKANKGYKRVDIV
jgi:HSP20 family protein